MIQRRFVSTGNGLFFDNSLNIQALRIKGRYRKSIKFQKQNQNAFIQAQASGCLRHRTQHKLVIQFHP